jgi:hypothetical protein
MTMKLGIRSIWVAVFMVQAVHAELRVWTDSKGKSIEAEHVRTTTDKVVLRQSDGTELSVSLDTLSEKDRRYAILLAPPRIDISVSTDVDRSNKGYSRNVGPGMQVQQETIVAEVNIRKSSSAPYEAPLVSEVYLIGRPEQTDHYVILERADSRFRFTTENKNEHTYSSSDVSLKQVESGRSTGLEFEGYLAVVRDKTGTILEMKCNKLDFQKNAEAILGSRRGTVFDEDFNPVDRKEAKREANKDRKYRVPGRRF